MKAVTPPKSNETKDPVEEEYFEGRPIFPNWLDSPWEREYRKGNALKFPVEESIRYIERELHAATQPSGVDERWDYFLENLSHLREVYSILNDPKNIDVMMKQDNNAIALAFYLGRLISSTTPAMEDLLENNEAVYRRKEAAGRENRGRSKKTVKQNTMKQDVLNRAEAIWQKDEKQQLILSIVARNILENLESEVGALESRRDYESAVAAAELKKRMPKVDTIKRWIREAKIAPRYAIQLRSR
jgi:hypothetical protein